ncbi:hypothetical protein DB346_01305 [Verrucomicrobia bacterium LW23]|nr:hypothetical protein DB346_01305 [Verrucomicrobia bacterium LW23]
MRAIVSVEEKSATARFTEFPPINDRNAGPVKAISTNVMLTTVIISTSVNAASSRLPRRACNPGRTCDDIEN